MTRTDRAVALALAVLAMTAAATRIKPAANRAWESVQGTALEWVEATVTAQGSAS